MLMVWGWLLCVVCGWWQLKWWEGLAAGNAKDWVVLCSVVCPVQATRGVRAPDRTLLVVGVGNAGWAVVCGRLLSLLLGVLWAGWWDGRGHVLCVLGDGLATCVIWCGRDCLLRGGAGAGGLLACGVMVVGSGWG